MRSSAWWAQRRARVSWDSKPEYCPKRSTESRMQHCTRGPGAMTRAPYEGVQGDDGGELHVEVPGDGAG
eukprot:6459851-Alexandrium_andersonii.AAC.1